MNVSLYSATSELSVCKACYRRLIKFKTASDHLEELKGELKGIFKDRKLPRTKRLLNVESDGGETQASCRGIGNPRNVCNSIRSIALVLLMLQPILVFLPRSANRYVIILRQDFLLVLLVSQWMRDSVFFPCDIRDLSPKLGREAGIKITSGSGISCFHRVGIRDSQR